MTCLIQLQSYLKTIIPENKLKVLANYCNLCNQIFSKQDLILKIIYRQSCLYIVVIFNIQKTKNNSSNSGSDK